MGTSTSSNGAPGGVPMVPPWVPSPVPPVDPAAPPYQQGADEGGQIASAIPSSNAPAGRFRGARASLGAFASSGNKSDLYRGIKHYVRKGYGGSAVTSSRMARTARTASSLYGALSAFAENQVPFGAILDRKLLTTYDAQGVISVVVEAVSPSDGTLDSEACREAIADALSELLDKFGDEDVNLLSLTEEQRAFAIEFYVAEDVYKHIVLDIGNSIRNNAPTIKDAMSRFNDIKSYVLATVTAAFKHLKDQGVVINSKNIARVASAALKETFEVFETYIK